MTPDPHDTRQVEIVCRIIRDREGGPGAWDDDIRQAAANPDGYATIRVCRVTAIARKLLAAVRDLDGS